MISLLKETEKLCIPSFASAGEQQVGETWKSSRRTRHILPPDLQTDPWSLGAEPKRKSEQTLQHNDTFT